MIVIPMAGLSSRFFNAGFCLPKYMLPLDGETIFEWSVKSFEKYFHSDRFLFIVTEHFNAPVFVNEKIQHMGILNYEVVVLKNNTLGQADTVFQGIQHLDTDEELLVFNIDSRLENFEKLEPLDQIEGYLEVFQGEGDHWSFVLPKDDNQVLQTAEKHRISSLCSNGLYYFNSSQRFKQYVQQEIDKGVQNELYIAPLYNHYIRDGYNIVFKEVTVDDINFCGTPAEYSHMLKKIEERSL